VCVIVSPYDTARRVVGQIPPARLPSCYPTMKCWSAASASGGRTRRHAIWSAEAQLQRQAEAHADTPYGVLKRSFSGRRKRTPTRHMECWSKASA